jgi:hypothetical protein
MKFLSTVEVGQDGFKPEERPSMRYIPEQKLPGTRLRLKKQSEHGHQNKMTDIHLEIK